MMYSIGLIKNHNVTNIDSPAAKKDDGLWAKPNYDSWWLGGWCAYFVSQCLRHLWTTHVHVLFLQFGAFSCWEVICKKDDFTAYCMQQTWSFLPITSLLLSDSLWTTKCHWTFQDSTVCAVCSLHATAAMAGATVGFASKPWTEKYSLSAETASQNIFTLIWVKVRQKWINCNMRQGTVSIWPSFKALTPNNADNKIALLSEIEGQIDSKYVLVTYTSYWIGLDVVTKLLAFDISINMKDIRVLIIRASITSLLDGYRKAKQGRNTFLMAWCRRHNNSPKRRSEVAAHFYVNFSDKGNIFREIATRKAK